jgi:hypothetical protein
MTKSSTTAKRAKRPSKAAKISPRSKPQALPAKRPGSNKDLDSEIFEMGRRHDAAWDACNRLDEDDPAIRGLLDTSIDLMQRMMLVQVRTPEGIAEKRRVARLQDLKIESNHCGNFIEFICQRDAERIAARPAASIRALVKRHAYLNRETDRLYDIGGDAIETEEYLDLEDELRDMPSRIVTTLASSTADIAAKWRFILKERFISDRDRCTNFFDLVEFLLIRDIESVGATIPALGDDPGAAMTKAVLDEAKRFERRVKRAHRRYGIVA